MAADGGGDLRRVVLEVVAGEAEGVEQAVDPDPGRQRVVVAQRELGVLAGLGQPFEQPEPAGDPGQAAAAVVDPPRDHLEAQRRARLDRQARARPGRASRPGCRCCGPAASCRLGYSSRSRREHAVAQQVGHLVEVAGRIEPLDRHVVGVVGSLALAPGPVEDRAAAGVADLLLVLVERLVAGLFPEEGQVAGHRDQPLADRLAAREVDRAVVAVVAGRRAGGARSRRASGSWSSRRAGSSIPSGRCDLAGLGEVDLQEAAVPAGELDERIDRLDHAGAGRPAAADAGGERDDGDLAPARAPPRPRRSLAPARRPCGRDQVGVVDVADVEVDRQAVARQADPPALEVVAKLLVLDGVEAVLAADPRGLLRPTARGRGVGGRPGDGEEVVDHRPEDAEQLAGLGAVVGEVVDVGLRAGAARRRARRRSSAGPGACSTREGIIAAAPVSSVGERAVRVDPEVVDDRLHREGQGVVERRPWPGA